MSLARELQDVGQALSPTQAVVHWLEEAKSHESFAEYSVLLTADPTSSPYRTIPISVALWAGHNGEHKTDRATGDRVDRAVRSALVRVHLVERLNRTVALGSQGDANQLDLRQLLEPLVLSGRVPAETENAWVEHAGRLIDEARIWIEGAARLGSQYFADRSPLFSDVARFLVSLRVAGEELLRGYNAATERTRARKPKGGPVDLGLIDEHVADLAPQHAAELVRLARIDAEVTMCRRREGFSIPRLVDLAGRQ